MGLAVTDPEQIIVSGLETVYSQELVPFLRKYILKENVVKIVLGHPSLLDVGASFLKRDVEELRRALIKRFPQIEIVYHDESFSSHRASEVILHSGAKRKKRKKKELIDKMSAVLILQEYLGHI